MRLFWFCLTLLIFSCTADSDSSSLIKDLEAEVETTPTNANVTELIEVYDSLLTVMPQNSAERKDILIKQYALAERHIRLANQVKALHQLILNYPNDPEYNERVVALGDAYSRTRRPIAAQVVYADILENNRASGQKKDELTAAVGDSTLNPDELIKSLGTRMFGQGNMRINSSVARSYIDACLAYAVVNNGDSASAENLHKAAETARSLGQMNEALDMYDWIIERYPNHPRTAQALFLKAFTYDSDLKDFEQARKYYTEFIEKYPENDFANSAEFLLENLGKDDEELLQILQEKANEQ